MDDFSAGAGSTPSGGGRGSCASDEGRRLLCRRYGLDDRARVTLAELRHELGIRREHVHALQREAQCTLKGGRYGRLRAGTITLVAAVQQTGGAA